MKEANCETCSDIYLQIRKDQRFCSGPCRNSYNNSKYSAQLKPYKKLIDNCRKTESDIEEVLSKGDRYFNSYELLQSNIDLNNALKIYVNCNNEISHAYFGKHVIILENSGYKIYTI